MAHDILGLRATGPSSEIGGCRRVHPRIRRCIFQAVALAVNRLCTKNGGGQGLRLHRKGLPKQGQVLCRNIRATVRGQQ